MFVVEMHRIPQPQGSYELFDCPGPHWRALRKLGERHGWVPAGTLPSPHINPAKAAADEAELAEIRAAMPPDWEDQARRMDAEAMEKGQSAFTSQGFNLRMRFGRLDLYEPRDWSEVTRMVTSADAAAWADSLDRACEELESMGVGLPHEGPVVVNLNQHLELNATMNEGLTRAFIRSFSAYLRGGSFGFAWDD